MDGLCQCRLLHQVLARDAIGTLFFHAIDTALKVISSTHHLMLSHEGTHISRVNLQDPLKVLIGEEQEYIRVVNLDTGVDSEMDPMTFVVAAILCWACRSFKVVCM
jgi:hypothetical protein